MGSLYASCCGARCVLSRVLLVLCARSIGGIRISSSIPLSFNISNLTPKDGCQVSILKALRPLSTTFAPGSEPSWDSLDRFGPLRSRDLHLFRFFSGPASHLWTRTRSWRSLWRHISTLDACVRTAKPREIVGLSGESPSRTLWSTLASLWRVPCGATALASSRRSRAWQLTAHAVVRSA